METITPRQNKRKIARKLDRGLANLKTRIDGLRVRARRVETEAKNMLEQRKAGLARKKNRLASRFDELKKTSGKAADRIKTKATGAYEGLKDAAHRTRKRLL